MNTETEALARRAIACPAWRWMPGMLMAYPKPRGAFGQVVYPSHARIADLPEPIGRGWGVIDPSSIGQGGLPDLSDPPTLGALFYLVRESFGPTFHLIAQGGWLAQGARLPNGATVNLGICEPTEAAALVAALEAASPAP